MDRAALPDFGVRARPCADFGVIGLHVRAWRNALLAITMVGV